MIEIQRTNGTFMYRQREDDPCIIESRPTYRGGRWGFVARFASADEARAALLRIERQAKEEGTP